jgi:hypothetical protein
VLEVELLRELLADAVNLRTDQVRIRYDQGRSCWHTDRSHSPVASTSALSWVMPEPSLPPCFRKSSYSCGQRPQEVDSSGIAYLGQNTVLNALRGNVNIASGCRARIGPGERWAPLQ